MRFSAVMCCLLAGLIYSEVTGETVQTAANVFNDRPFLWVEAENFSMLGDDPENDGWKVVSKENPITSMEGVPILPADSNVSGTALLDDVGGGGHSDTALYEMKFITPGTYQLYTRHSMYDSSPGNGSYGNEDSIYLSPAFNKNSSSDWVGFEGLNFDENDVNVDIPNNGFAADPAGFKPATGDSANDGWFALRDWGVKSMGSVSFPNTVGTGEWDGHFNWYNRPFFVDTNEGGGFSSDFGFKTEYTVTPDMVGETLTFEMGTREPYGVLDGFLFIKDDDVDLLDMFSQEDLDEGILPLPVNGDYNNNGVVDAADYVLWRDGGPLANDQTPGVQSEDYDVWRANFGQASGSAAGLGSSGVPEPGSLVMLISAIAASLAGRAAGPRSLSASSNCRAN